MRTLLLPILLLGAAAADVDIDIEAFGESLGGWKKGGASVDYELSGADYRTYKPEITPTPDGGIFASIRIDHLRGWLASDDHAVLEVSFSQDGSVVSAQSTLAIQGRTITSDLIRSSAEAGSAMPGVAGAVKVGTDLVADLSAKLLREKIVEPGRVAFPSALRHNYNLLFQAVQRHAADPTPRGEAPPAADNGNADPPRAEPLEIKPYGGKR